MLLILICTAIMMPLFANSSYLFTIYGSVVKDGFGSCVHTAYFKKSEGLDICNEANNDAAISTQ